MANLKKKFLSFVALGGQNPQILNLDFLKANNIIPVNVPPFEELLKQEKPFTKFVSTPVFSSLVLGTIEFIVDEQRFQIRDTSIDEWADTKILNIAQKYYEILQYTPIKKVGINFNSELTFETSQEAVEFQKLFLSEGAPLCKMISSDNLTASIVINYPEPNNEATIALAINRLNTTKNNRTINFNYEFDFTDWQQFSDKLTKVPEIAEYYDNILHLLIEAI